MLLKFEFIQPVPAPGDQVIARVIQYQKNPFKEIWFLEIYTGFRGPAQAEYLKGKSRNLLIFGAYTLVEGRDFTVTEVDRFPPLESL